MPRKGQKVRCEVEAQKKEVEAQRRGYFEIVWVRINREEEGYVGHVPEENRVFFDIESVRGIFSAGVLNRKLVNCSNFDLEDFHYLKQFKNIKTLEKAQDKLQAWYYAWRLEEARKADLPKVDWLKRFGVPNLRTNSLWRRNSRKVIRKVLQMSESKTISDLKKEISKAYPFGERKYTPYKIWREEVKFQLGEKTKKFTKKEKLELVQEGQKELF